MFTERKISYEYVTDLTMYWEEASTLRSVTISP